MHSIFRLAIALCLCGLTLAASGDDVSLLGIMAPSLGTKALPLDDPNTDFTASIGSATKNTYQAPHIEMAAVPCALPPLISAAAPSLLLCLEPVLPLHCCIRSHFLRC